MWRKDMRHSPAFTMWLFLKEDQQPGALIAKSLWVPVDGDEPKETPAERAPDDTGVPPADRIRLRSID